MKLESENALLLKDFIEENWEEFLKWMVLRGQSESDAEDICLELDAVFQKG